MTLDLHQVHFACCPASLSSTAFAIQIETFDRFFLPCFIVVDRAISKLVGLSRQLLQVLCEFSNAFLRNEKRHSPGLLAVFIEPVFINRPSHLLGQCGDKIRHLIRVVG